MRVLSLYQPWAWLVVNGWKNVENRPWKTNIRGRVLIHASKRMTRSDYEACLMFVEGFSTTCFEAIPQGFDLERGGIVGETTILDCVTHHSSEWFTGPFGFVLADSKPLPFVPCRGFQRWFDVKPGTG